MGPKSVGKDWIYHPSATSKSSSNTTKEFTSENPEKIFIKLLKKSKIKID
jgi:hypothetical protein